MSLDPERHLEQEQCVGVVESLVKTFIRLHRQNAVILVLHVTVDIQRRNQKTFSSI